MMDKKPRNTKLIQNILNLIIVSGGLTANEIADRLAIDVRYIRPRLTELRKAGRLFITGEKRANALGRASNVWALFPKKATAKDAEEFPAGSTTDD